MKPVKFDDSNITIGPPKGVDESDCGTLPALTLKGGGFVSCWELEEGELEKIKENGGKVFLTVHTPQHPMVSLSVEKPYRIQHDPRETN